jgi:hypothetical protein
LKEKANEKANLLSIPTTGWQDPDRKTDDELIEIALEKATLHVQHEIKVLRDEFLNIKMELGGRIKEKLDRKEMEEV